MRILNSLIKGIKKIPFAGRFINRIATNRKCKATTPRPRAFSLWSHEKKPVSEQGPVGEYTTWPMLTDRQFSGRHLPPAAQAFVDDLPKDTKPEGGPEGRVYGDVTNLFARQGEMDRGRSSMLFMFFAQWFTDSILRTDPTDRRKNTSNHNIDLCQIYGLTEKTTNLLRSKNGGKLKSQPTDKGDYLDYLGVLNDNNEWSIKDEYKLTMKEGKFQGLPYATDKTIEMIFGKHPEERKHTLYATGLERGNSSIGYVAISTIFMREHNRICDELFSRNPTWDDERLFQTARMINIVILMKVVVQDYINHIVGMDVFEFDRSFAEKQKWYRTPWMSLEFDLLYRWHGLVPDTIEVEGTVYKHTEYRTNNALLEKVGLETVISAASTQHAGKIKLHNTPGFLLDAEYATIKMGRDSRLRSYNDYRQQFGLDPQTSFDELTDDDKLSADLELMYKDVDNLEYFVGLFAEGHQKGQLYGDLMYAMVAYDAFTQIYTNPLLSENVYHAKTFSEYGIELIDKTNSVQDLVNRNVREQENVVAKFGM